jgi:hypothetical protein
MHKIPKICLFVIKMYKLNKSKINLRNWIYKINSKIDLISKLLSFS